MKAKISFLLAIVFVMSIFLSACGNGGNEVSGQDKTKGETTEKSGNNGKEQLADQQVLNLASTSDIPTMDVNDAIDATSSDAMTAVYSGLIRLDDHGNPVPDMAAEKPKVSKDKKTWTFKIRKDAKWSNGDPITANDWVFAWQREIDPDTASEYSFLFIAAGIKNAKEILDKDSDIFGKVDKLGIKAIDDHTLQINLSEPQPFFESLLWFGPFLPLDEKVVKKYGDKYATDVDKMVFNGPYKMTSWKHGDGWEFEKNDDYWDTDSYKLKKVTFKVVKDTSTQVNLYQTGKIDETSLEGEYIDQFKGKPGFKQGLKSATKSIRVAQRTPALKNEKIRKALYNGIDREGLANILLKDGSIPAYGEVPKDFVTGPDGKDFRAKYPEINKMPLDKAKELWKQGLKEIGKDSVTLTLIVSDISSDNKIATFVKDQYEKNFKGLHININKQPWNSFLQLYLKKKYDLCLIGFAPDYNDPITFLDIFTTGNQQNTMDISDKKYDQMVEEAKHMATEPEKRWEKMQEAEKMLLEHADDIPLYQSGHSWVQQPYVKNMKFPVYGVDTDWYKAYIVKH